MQRLEVSGAVRHIYASLGFKGLILKTKGYLYLPSALTFATRHFAHTVWFCVSHDSQKKN